MRFCDVNLKSICLISLTLSLHHTYLAFQGNYFAFVTNKAIVFRKWKTNCYWSLLQQFFGGMSSYSALPRAQWTIKSGKKLWKLKTSLNVGYSIIKRKCNWQNIITEQLPSIRFIVFFSIVVANVLSAGCKIVMELYSCLEC